MADERKFIDNEKGYNLWAASYDLKPSSLVVADDRAFPPYYAHLTDKKVLEIGCGTGRHTIRLVAQKNQVTAIDQSINMLSLAQQKIPPGAAEFILADFTKYDLWKPNTFSAIICSLVLEHIADLKVFFEKAFSVLQTNGEIFLSEIHPTLTARGSQARFRIDSERDDPGNEIWLTSSAHTSDEVTGTARSAGFFLKSESEVRGDETLAQVNSEWGKHLGKPILKIWCFSKA